MIRLACPQDAEQLFQLNQQFNGPSCTTPQAIARSLAENPREIVAVAEEDGVLTGFVCAQLKVSFCYERPTAEITEVFLAQAFRRQGLPGPCCGLSSRSAPKATLLQTSPC